MKKVNFKIVEFTTAEDEERVLQFRQKHFFDERGIQDPYAWTVGHKTHDHFILEVSGKMIGYAHVQYWPEHRAALRIIVIDKKEQRKGYGSFLMKCCEELLKEKGVGVLQTEAHPDAVHFYQQLGYIKMPFEDPEGHPTHENDTALGKRIENPQQYRFVPAESSQREMLHRWFEQKHIKEWMHGIGLQNTLKGLEKFFQGQSKTTYWIGYDKAIPFVFFITSPEDEHTITLDMFICDLNYLGKGLSAFLIREFLISHFSHVKRVLIDPEATNKRAIHVYEKVGFKIIGEFIASWHPVPHYQMELSTKNLRS